MQPLGFSYVRSNLEMDNSLKKDSFQHSERSDNKRYIVEVR